MQNLTGQTLGQYEIVEKIGEGGMGAVFKARQPDLERWVAVKVLPPQYANSPGFSDRFLREARAIAQLEHPNILPVYDFGQCDEYTYLVMRYIEASRSLTTALRGPLSFQQITDYLSQTAAALDYAHRRGIIHRDVKPGNILLNSDNWIFLADFGLARMAESTATRLTGTGVGLGTPAYMSPEQGAGRAVDARTDVYAVGVIAYRMLTGHIPHQADTPHAIIYKRNTEPPPALRTINPNIPPAIEQCVQMALALEPAERFQSAGAFATALGHIVDEANLGHLLSTTLTAPQIAPGPSPPPLSQQFCSQCGTRLMAGMAFCGHCGHSVATSSQAQNEKPAIPTTQATPAAGPAPPTAVARQRGKSVRANTVSWSWGIAAVIGLGIFVAGIAFGVVEVMAMAAALVLVVAGIYLYQHYEEWLG